MQKSQIAAPDCHPRRHSRSLPRLRSWLVAASCSLLASAAAAPPVLTHLYPVAGQRGTSIAVSIGKGDSAWPRGIWTDTKDLFFTPTPILGTWNVDIAPDASAGPHLVRAWNEEGVSSPRFFIISKQRDIHSVEPNDEPTAPQSIAEFPATISGRLDKKGDVDGYAVKLQKGQTLVAWMAAYVLASTFDGLLRITDEQGRVLAFNHDGRNYDPLLAWTAPRDGTFIVQLMGFAYPAQASEQLTGGEGCVYRLHLSTGPVARLSLPLAVQAGTRQTLHWVGWNLPSQPFDFDATSLQEADSTREVEGITLLQPIAISGLPELLEPDAPAKVTPMEVPSAITGRIRTPGEVDRFKFAATKGQSYRLDLTAASVGSPLDAWIAVENPEGKELARNDDEGSRDPELTWTAPAAGNFSVAIGNLTRRGADDQVYRLTITTAQPEITGTIAAHSATAAPGKTAELKVAIKRANGFKAKLLLHAKDLPPGVTATPVEVPEKDGEVTLSLSADATAAPIGAPFRIVLKEAESQREHPVRHSLVSSSENNGVPQGYTELVINSTDLLWLTITAK